MLDLKFFGYRAVLIADLKVPSTWFVSTREAFSFLRQESTS